MPVADVKLLKNGLLVDVDVGPSAAYRAAMWRQGKTVPPAVSATFLVDTGCDSTTVSEQLMRTLSLVRIAQTRVVTGTTDSAGHPADVFAVELTLFPHLAQPRSWSAWQVVALPFVNQGTEGLLGRDVLSHLVLTYDGPQQLARMIY